MMIPNNISFVNSKLINIGIPTNKHKMRPRNIVPIKSLYDNDKPNI